MRMVAMNMRETNFHASAFTQIQISTMPTTNARLSAAEFADQIFAIQSNCTKKSYICSQTQSKHPWAKGNLLRKATATRNKARRNYRTIPSIQNKDILARANRAQYDVYNELKRKYYDDLVGQQEKFFPTHEKQKNQHH